MLIRIFCFPFCINRSELKHDIGKLTTTTGLLFQHFTVFNSLLKCFFISNLGSTLVYFHFKLTTHTVNDDLKVQFTHSTKDGLSGIFICFYTQVSDLLPPAWK